MPNIDFIFPNYKTLENDLENYIFKTYIKEILQEGDEKNITLKNLQENDDLFFYLGIFLKRHSVQKIIHGNNYEFSDYIKQQAEFKKYKKQIDAILLHLKNSDWTKLSESGFLPKRRKKFSPHRNYVHKIKQENSEKRILIFDILLTYFNIYHFHIIPNSDILLFVSYSQNKIVLLGIFDHTDIKMVRKNVSLLLTHHPEVIQEIFIVQDNKNKISQKFSDEELFDLILNGANVIIDINEKLYYFKYGVSTARSPFQITLNAIYIHERLKSLAELNFSKLVPPLISGDSFDCSISRIFNYNSIEFDIFNSNITLHFLDEEHSYKLSFTLNTNNKVDILLSKFTT